MYEHHEQYEHQIHEQPRSARRADMVGPREAEVRRLSPGQTVMLAIAMVIALIGAGLMVYTWTVPASAAAASDATPYASDLGDPLPAAPEPSALQIFAPAIFKFGCSFVIGFAAGYVFKTFVRIALTLVGLAVVAGVAMHVAGMLEINWDAMGHYADLASKFALAQTGSLKVIAAGAIPPAASALVGLLSGFRRL
jgi:uncharacterized membrane protein (Fun14 family)